MPQLFFIEVSETNAYLLQKFFDNCHLPRTIYQVLGENKLPKSCKQLQFIFSKNMGEFFWGSVAKPIYEKKEHWLATLVQCVKIVKNNESVKMTPFKDFKQYYGLFRCLLESPNLHHESETNNFFLSLWLLISVCFPAG